MPITSIADPIGYRSEVHMTSSPDSLFARGAHKTQENSSLTRLPVYYKKTQPSNSQTKDAEGEVRGRNVELLCSLSACHPPRISMCSPASKISRTRPLGFYGGGFIMWARPIESLSLGDHLNLQSSDHTVGSPGNQHLFSGAFQKSAR